MRVRTHIVGKIQALSSYITDARRYIHLKIIIKKFKEREDTQKKHVKGQKKLFENHQSIFTKLISDNNILINQRMNLFVKEIHEVKSNIEITDSVLRTQAKMG